MTTEDKAVEIMARNEAISWGVDPDEWEGFTETPKLHIIALAQAGLEITQEREPVRYERLNTVTDEQRDQAHKSELWQVGDVIAVLVNEGDVCNFDFEALPSPPGMKT